MNTTPITKPRFSTRIDATNSGGHMFVIMSTARLMMRQLNVSNENIDKMTTRVLLSKSYAEALAVVREWFPVDTKED